MRVVRRPARPYSSIDACQERKFFGRELVALAGFFEAQQAATNGGDDFGLAANNPATRICRRKIGNRERTTVGPDHILDARSNQIGHITLYATQTHGTQSRSHYRHSFKNCLSGETLEIRRSACCDNDFGACDWLRKTLTYILNIGRKPP
jgi:hypothetical protein